MWFKERNILLKEAGQDGGSGGASIEDSFTQVDDFEDDFDLSSLRDNNNQDSDEDQKGKVNLEEGKTPDGKIVNLPDDEEDDENKGGSSEGQKTEEEELATEAEERGITVDELKAEIQEAEKAETEKLEAREKELEDLRDQMKKDKKSDEEIEKAIADKEQEFIDQDMDDEINPFKELTPSDSKDDGKDKAPTVNFNELATEIGYEVEEGVEIKSMDEFKEVAKKNLDKAKKEIDTESFSPEAKMLIENLQKNKDLQLTDFYRNETIRSIDNFLSLPDDRKVKSVLAEEGKKKNLSGEELKDFVEDTYSEMTDEDIANQLKEINRNASSVKSREFSKIIKQKNEFFDKQVQLAEQEVAKERKNLVEKIKNTKTYNGFKIPESAINVMVQEIESGQFQNILDENVEEAKINAYIGIKLGKQIEAAYQKMLKKAKGESYNKGLDTVKKMKYNIKSGGSGQSTGKRAKDGISFSSSLFEEE